MKRGTACPLAPVAPRRSSLAAALRRLGIALAGMGALGAALLLAAPVAITLGTLGTVVADPRDVPPTAVALVLGTARTHQGRPNQFYQARIASAAALYHSGRVRGLLLSGDNATIHYNEPWSMRKDLIALGVPAEYITLDYAGFRTLDSVARAKTVFGIDRLVIVSQRFHCERAIFLARRFGIAATGLAAPDPGAPRFWKIRAREVLARALAWRDLSVGRAPKFLGPLETVKLRPASAEPTHSD